MVAEALIGAYVVALTIWYCSNRKVNHHKSLTNHLTNLCDSFPLLVPCSNWPISLHNLSHQYSRVEYASLAVTLLQTAVAGTISTGPSCQVDLTRLYNKAVTAKIDETGKTMHNVNEEISTSIFGKLVFSYVFPVISKTAAMEQVGMDDVPAAHAYFRTQNIIHESVHINDNGGLRSKFGPTTSVLWTVCT